jgi:hypothetical protein
MPRQLSVSAPRRFKATILRLGVNPYVDVPLSVSRAFDEYARDGRISVRVRLNGHETLGTLIPVKRGQHRFFINGGMRAAADVSVGDTVSIELRATHPDDVPTPADVRQALRVRPGARKAFDKLAPSHRRHLLRYIDDARTPEGRVRRITNAVNHVLGVPRNARQARKAASRALWRCPRCDKEFVNRNQYHSCKRYDLKALFEKKPPEIRALYDRFHEMVQQCGPSKMLPYRDKVAYMVRVRFAGAVPAMKWLDVGFWLTHRVESPRFRKIETLDPNAHVHLVRITAPEQLDAEVAAWLAEAYEVGCQRHLT